MKTCCSVLGCSNRGGHTFPQNKVQRQKWIKALKREAWIPSKSSVVCRNHFKDSDFVDVDSLMRKRLKADAIPTLFHWNTTEKENVSPGTQKTSRTYMKPVRKTQDENLKHLNNINPIETEQTRDMNFDMLEICIVNEEDSERSVGTQTEGVSNVTKVASSSTQTIKILPFSIYHFTNNPKAIHFFTGLENFSKVQYTFFCLGPAVDDLKYFYNNPPAHIDLLNRFFLTLIYLRTHKTHYEISLMFNITIKEVTNICITWIRFMSLQWREITIWPSKSLVNFYSPTDFKNKFANTRVILDGTEIPINRPELPTAQQATFSTYKNKNTLKVLVGCTPGGLVSMVSSAYGGSASDRQLVERTNICGMCDPQDSIMADKGFNIEDMLAPYRINLNIPTFFRKRNRINPIHIRKDRKIASKRVHIERMIGLAKTYKILNGPLSKTEIFLADDIIFVCFMLCNFRKNIMNKY